MIPFATEQSSKELLTINLSKDLQPAMTAFRKDS